MVHFWLPPPPQLAAVSWVPFFADEAVRQVLVNWFVTVPPIVDCCHLCRDGSAAPVRHRADRHGGSGSLPGKAR
jgi:hypothetical protein